MSRFLFGPVVDDHFHERFLAEPVNDNRWRTFTAGTGSFADAVGGWDAPDAVLLWMPAAALPDWVWSCPIPVVALAAEPHLLWHSYRHVLPHADLIVCDAPATERFTRAGLNQVRAGNLSGLDRHVLAEAALPSLFRDVDIAFLLDHNPAVQPRVLPWLGRLADLAERYRVRIASGLEAAEIRALLRRTKLAFNLSSHGECNRRALEAAALGAVLLQEADNQEIDDYLARGSEFVPFTVETLPEVVAQLLADEKQREELADRARRRVVDYRFDTLIESAVGVGSRHWPAIIHRAQQRSRHPAGLGLSDRLWLHLARPAAKSDPSLVEDLARANDRYGLALIASSPSEAAPYLAACAPRNRVAAVAHAAVLNELGRQAEAIQELHGVLAELEGRTRLSPAERDTVPYPPRYDLLRVAWERAGYDYPDNLEHESQAKVRLLRSRAHTLLAGHTGDLTSYQVAAEAEADLPATRAALGCALARAGRLEKAIEQLRQAVAADPLDHPAARALITALTEQGDPREAATVRAVRQRLAKAAPGMVPMPEELLPRRGEAAPRSIAQAADRLEINWDGEVGVVHSLAAVNQRIVGELVNRGHEVGLPTGSSRAVGGTPCELPPVLLDRLGRTLADALTVRHRWPPDFTPPSGAAAFVLMQPWEYGRLPRSWVEPIVTTADEVWVYSEDTRRTYVASGVPEQRVAVIPLGVNLSTFHPHRAPLPLETHKTIKLLFVGGTIRRKGFDCLLQAYAQAFTDRDDVCLVVKDLGADSFYRGQTAGAAIERVRAQPGAPEILYLNRDLSEDELARLYTACDTLVHPYRGEGFALPVLEAMASGRPVVVTAGGPTDELVPPAAGWRVPAVKKEFETGKVGDLETVGRPWWLEPDVEALTELLRQVVGGPRERGRRGHAARQAATGWSWARTAATIENRLRQLREREPVRLKHWPPEKLACPPSTAVVEATRPVTFIGLPTSAVPAVVAGRPRVSLTMIVKNEEANLGDCLASVRDLVDEAIVVDTGSTDRTKEIARSFGAIVGEFPWIDDFAAARNAALDLATGDYAFWMDADDRLDEENRARLRAVFQALPGGNEAYVMKCLCVSDRSGSSGTTVDHVRLFRRVPSHRWEYRIHEQILPALRATGTVVSWAGVTIRHVGYVDSALRRRKLERDIRLLKLEDTHRPGDPFTLFNLGSVYHEIGDYLAAIAPLELSLARSQPRDSIVRKLYALLAQCHFKLGNPEKAMDVCRAGRVYYPHDAELLFLAAGLARDRGAAVEAEGYYRQLMEGREGDHFASVDDALRTVKGPHNLAVLLVDLNRLAEAEELWQKVLAVAPHFLVARLGLGDLYIRAKNPTGLSQIIVALRDMGVAGATQASALEARWLSAEGNHAAGIAVLERALEREPRAVPLRVAMSHLRLVDGSPPEVLEAAFLAVLEVDPANAQARHNLEVFLRTTERPRPLTSLPARARVSLTMIVRDEAANLATCLNSVRDLIDDLVVVDTGSTDRTVEIATGFGARIVSFPWRDDFAAARNAGLDAAEGEWVFWLDADECLDPPDREKARRLFADLKDENAAYLMRQLSPSDEPGGATTAVDQVRLFRRRPDIRWEYRIHEQILLSVRRTRADVRATDIVIAHRGYHTAAIRDLKLARNTRLLELAHREQPDDLILAFNLAWVYHKTERAADALSLLQRCRAALPPEYSIAPKVYRLLGQAYDRLHRTDDAREAFAAGRKLFPDDVELLLHQGLFLQCRKEYLAAESNFRRILSLRSGKYPVGLDLGLLGYKTRNALADLYTEQKRWQEAETEWRAALAEEPGFTLGKVGLATIAFEQGRTQEAVDILDKLGPPDSLVLSKVERLRRRLVGTGGKPS